MADPSNTNPRMARSPVVPTPFWFRSRMQNTHRVRGQWEQLGFSLCSKIMRLAHSSGLQISMAYRETQKAQRRRQSPGQQLTLAPGPHHSRFNQSVRTVAQVLRIQYSSELPTLPRQFARVDWLSFPHLTLKSLGQTEE